MITKFYGPKKLAALIATGAMLAATPFAAQADSLRYSYWQLGYVGVDVDGLSDQADGWAVGLSYEVTERIFIAAGYTDVGATEAGTDIDEQDLSLGVGYAYPVSPNNDLIGRIGYVRAEGEIEGFGSGSDDGYSLGVGWRTHDRMSMHHHRGAAADVTVRHSMNAAVAEILAYIYRANGKLPPLGGHHVQGERP